MIKKHINVLAIGASYTGEPRLFEAIAEGLGGNLNFLVLNGLLGRGDGFTHQYFQGNDTVSLESNRGQKVAFSDVLHTRNMDAYEPRSGNRHVAAMIEKVNKAKETGGWDVITLTPHSSWGHNPGKWHEDAVTGADSLRAHLPGVKVYLVQNPAYRNDCLVFQYYNWPNVAGIMNVDDGERITETSRYKDIRASFETAAQLMNADGIIPNATAFQNARFDEEWGYMPADGGPAYPDPNYDYQNTFPNDTLPRRTKRLCAGFRIHDNGVWSVNNHPRFAGELLLSLDLIQMVFKQDVRTSAFNHRIGTSGEVDAQDAEILKRIAYQTCVEGLMPDTTTFLEYEW